MPAKGWRKKICVRGHALTGRNLTDSGKCRRCNEIRQRRYYESNKEAILIQTKAYAKAHPEIPKRSHENRRLREHCLTQEQLEQKLKEQKRKCAICGGINIGKALDIDHDHKCCSGETSCPKCTRGLLCNVCNKKLHVIEDEVFMKAATEYLKKWTQNAE